MVGIMVRIRFSSSSSSKKPIKFSVSFSAETSCCSIMSCFRIWFLSSWQLRSTSLAGTPVRPPPACRAMKRLFTRLARHWASPASLATSCRAKPPSTASPDTRRSGTTPRLPAEVQHASIVTNVIIGCMPSFIWWFHDSCADAHQTAVCLCSINSSVCGWAQAGW